MMAARFLPFRLANRRNLAPRYVPWRGPAAWAHSTRTARSHLLPLPVRPLLRFPALSLFPGLTLGQEQRCLAEGNHAISTPISATRSCAVRWLTPGIVSRSAIASAYG